MLSITELQTFYWAAGAILAANIIAMAMFVLFAKLPDGKFRQSIQAIITELDKFADEMSNPDKKREAIRQVSDILGWRRILVPATLMGWVIDAEVAAIRKMQAATDTPDLHQ